MRRFWAIVILASVISAAAVSCSKDTASGQSVPEGPGEQGLEQISFIAGRQGITGTKAGESGAVFSLGEACTQDCAGEGADQCPPDAQAAAGTQNGPCSSGTESGSAQSSTAEPQTKSRFDTSTAIHWTENEELVVYDDVLGDAHTFHAASAGASSPIIGSVCVGAHTYWSVSPASAAVSFNPSTQTAVVSVPSSQTLSGTAQYASDPAAMVAVAKIVRNSDGSMPEGGVEYNNICGFIRFKFSASVTQLTLRSLNGSLLAGNVQVDMSGASPSTGEVKFGSESVTVRADSEGNPFTLNREYTVPVLVGSGLSGVNFSYLEGDTEYYGRATFTDPLLPGCGQQLGDLHGKGSSGVSGFTATPLSTSSIRLDWNNMNIPGATVKYEIRRTSADINNPDDPSKVVVASNLSAATVNDNGLDDGTAYRFYIRAYDGTGTPVSGWGRTAQMSKILQPASVTVTGTKANELSVAFTEPRGADYYTVTVSGTTGTLPANITSSPITITSATRNTTGITVTVVARNSVYTHAGVSSDSRSGTGRTGYFSGGAGTEASPFLISCKADLDDLMDWTGNSTYYPDSGTNASSTDAEFRTFNYLQTNDIEGTPSSYMIFPKYVGWGKYKGFEGVYDGDNHYVSYYQITDTNNVALFGSVCYGGTVKNLKTRYFKPLINGTDRNYQGAVCGRVDDGHVLNCHYEAGDVTFCAAYCGGVVGIITGTSTVTNCTVGGDSAITFSKSTSQLGLGGIVGMADPGTSVSGCSVTGTLTLTPSNDRTGGIVSIACGNVEITNCSITGNLTINASTHHNNGGILGFVTNSGDIAPDVSVSGCTVSGTLNIGGTDNNSNAGIVGYAKDATAISNCSVGGTVSISGKVNNGGIVGLAYGTTISGCTVSGKASNNKSVTITGGDVNTGGIVGRASYCSISGSSVKWAVLTTTYSRVGGIAGFLLPDETTYTIRSTCSGCSVTDCKVQIQTTTAEDEELNVGGIAGHARGTDISDCHFTKGDVINNSSADLGRVGGIAGSACDATITGCSLATQGNVNITSKSYHVGGIVGLMYIFKQNNMGVTLTNNVIDCYSSGYNATIKGTNFVGGIAGGYNTKSAQAELGSNVEFQIIHCTVKGNGVKVEASGAGAGGILGGARDGSDLSATVPYTLTINNCYIQEKPKIQGSKSTFASGTSAILGRPSMQPDGCTLKICNCVIGSGYLYDTAASGQHIMGGLVGYLRAPCRFTALIFNNASYIDKYIHTDNNITAAVGSLIGWCRPDDSRPDEEKYGDLRIYGNATDFKVSTIAKGNFDSYTSYSAWPTNYCGKVIGTKNSNFSYFRLNYLVSPKSGRLYPETSDTETGIFCEFSTTLGSSSDSATTASVYGNIKMLNSIGWDTLYSPYVMKWTPKTSKTTGNYAYISRDLWPNRGW